MSKIKVLDPGDRIWPEQSDRGICLGTHVSNVKTLTTDSGQWFACEHCSAAWFKSYAEIRSAEDATVGQVKP